MRTRKDIHTGLLLFIHPRLDIGKQFRSVLGFIDDQGGGEVGQESPRILKRETADIGFFQRNILV